MRLLVLLALATTPAAAQNGPADSPRAEIQARLRAFYFNLAHHDWEALTADILAAKVVAHRPAPPQLAVNDNQGPTSCRAQAAPLLSRARIQYQGDWADVSVPWCSTGFAVADQFRLIRFDNRWRFIHIDLAKVPVAVVSGR